jgi:hypothetical protein
MPLGSVGFENEVNAKGERTILLEPLVLEAAGTARPRRELQRRDLADGGGEGANPRLAHFLLERLSPTPMPRCASLPRAF